MLHPWGKPSGAAAPGDKRQFIFIHKLVEFYLRFRYSMFKTKKYSINRKVAEAVNRFLSNSVDPLFYLSSFQTLSRKTPVPGHSHRGFSIVHQRLCGHRQTYSGLFLDFSFLSSIIKAENKHKRSAFHVL